MRFQHLLLGLCFSFLTISGVSEENATAERPSLRKSPKEFRKQFQAAYFDAKRFAAAVPADTVVYARIGSLPSLADGLQQIRPHTAASLSELPRGEVPPRVIKRDYSHAINPLPKSSAYAAALVLVSPTGEVSRIFVCEARPRSFGRRLADTIADWKYQPSKINGQAVPTIVYEQFTSGPELYLFRSDIPFDQSDEAKFLALKESITPLYAATQFATTLPQTIVVWPSDLTSSPVFQNGLKQLRQHTQTRFIAYPSSQPPIIIDRHGDTIYPSKHKRNGKEGEAHVFLLINTKGRIVKFYVTEATDEIFAAAAVRVLTDWIFTPAELEGRPVPFMTMQTVKFTLDDNQ